MSSELQEIPPPTINISIGITFICTITAWALFKTKRTPDEKARLRQELWELQFQPFVRPGIPSAIAVCGLLAFFSLAVHSVMTIGAGVTLGVAGCVVIIFQHHGFLKVDVRKNLQRCFLKGSEWYQVDPTDSTVQTAPKYPKVPVWVLTGFLGSGKTTLVNRLLRVYPHFLVIENEAGDVDVDAELICQACDGPENIVLVKDGCACCKVRGDLPDMLKREVLALRAAKKEIDGIIIECSGLADPAAVVQTFVLDKDMREMVSLREAVAIVDAAHAKPYLCNLDQSDLDPLAKLVQEQIAFSSLVLLNKVDLAEKELVHELESRVKEVNATAKILQCTHCNVDLQEILNMRAASYPLPEHSRRFTEGSWAPAHALLEVERIKLKAQGSSTQRTSHRSGPVGKNPGRAVRCVTVSLDGELDIDVFNRWILRLLGPEDHAEILRAKGVLSVSGHDEKFVFQAVHGRFEGTAMLSARWKPGEKRFSQIVLIGREIQEHLMEYGLRSCLATADQERHEKGSDTGKKLEQLTPGAKVKLHSLKTQALNGLQGELVEFVADSGRWRCKVMIGKEQSMKDLKPENLSLCY